jgi:hypothetical protein
LKTIFGDNWEQMLWFQCFDVNADEARIIRERDPSEPGLAVSISEEIGS